MARAAGVPTPSSALPVAAWVGYGGTMVGGAYLLTYGISGGYVDTGVILVVVSLGAGSAIAMGADAIHVAGLTEDAAVASLPAAKPPRLVARPFYRPGTGGGVVGLAGQF